jgi:uridine kinase
VQVISGAKFGGNSELVRCVDCTFETALERAVSRGQEGLSPDDTVRAYRTLYFPAQEIHLERDEPRAAATAIICNDPRLSDDGAQSRWAG